MHHFWSRTTVNPRRTPQERVNARGMRSGGHGLQDEDERASYLNRGPSLAGRGTTGRRAPAQASRR